VTQPILRCTGVDVSYGPVQVLFGVDLEVGEGEIVALLGTNGAGKSTLLKAVTGLVEPTKGTVEFQGTDITGRPADQVTRAGVSLMPGGKGVFPTLSVEENLRLAGWLLRDDPGAVADARARVLELFPILDQRIGEMAGNLSGGEQQMLALAQSFICRPALLMIDELSLGLAPTVVGQLLDVVRRIHEQGTTILLVEQSVNVALTLAQRAVFMEKGEVRFEGPTAELLDRPDILRSVFIAGANARDRKKSANSPGSTVDLRSNRASSLEDQPVVLECREVTKRFGGIRAVDGVDIGLRKGQILGLIGQNGAGKTTLLDCVSGFLSLDGGRVLLRGHDVSDWPAFDRAANGLGRSFQDARLFPSLTVAETIAVALERHLQSRDVVAAALHLPAAYESELAAAKRVEELVELMGLGAFHEKLVSELSTGLASSPRTRVCCCSTSRPRAWPSASRRRLRPCCCGCGSTRAAPCS
jgi:ABC-type branched-subunit amino acid transport system ATPase component